MATDPSAPDDWLALTHTPGLRPATLRRLVSALGSAAAVRVASHALIVRTAGEHAAQCLLRGPDPARLAATHAWLAQGLGCVVAIDDPRYPPLLAEIPDPPPVLYARGRLDLLAAPALAIVGSRSASAQGVRTAEAFAGALADAGLTIVSGLAQGIDAAAHRGALAGAAGTIAVLGTGIDRIYPPRNKPLALEIAERGLVLSELPPGTPPLPANFPRRNRIISGIARGCLVVEAAIASGSLVTARCAADQGRDVFAIPGSIHSPLARGCHALIRQGAKLVESAADVLEELGGSWRAARPVQHDAADTDALSDDARLVLDAAGHDPCVVDLLVDRTGLAIERVNAALIELEIAGLLENLPGDRYQRLF